MQHHITASAEEPSAPDRLFLPLLAAGHASTHWYAGVLSALLPWIREDLGLTYAQIGLLMTGRALLGACGNVATSIAADLGGRRRNILIGSVFMVALCYILVGMSTSLLMLLLFGSMAAMASNAWHPPAMSLLGERFPDRRGYALGWHGTGANLGQTISPLVVGAMLSFMSWRATLYVNIWPGLLMGLLLLWLLPMLDDDHLARRAKGYWSDLKSGLVYNTAVMKVAVLSILRTMGQQGFQTFLPLYLAESLHFSPALVGVGLSIMTFSGSWLEPLSGLLSDRIGRKPILLISLLLSALAVWSLTLVSGVWLPLLLVGLIGLLHLSLRPIIMAFAMDVTPSGIGASTIGFVFSVNQLFSAFTPLMTGYLADVYDLKTAFYVFAVLTLIAALWVPLMSYARTEDAVA